MVGSASLIRKQVQEYLAPTIFGALSEADRNEIAQHAKVRGFLEHEGSIWAMNDMIDQVLFVASGGFRVMRTLERRPKSVLLFFARRGTVLGISQLVGQPRTTEVFAAKRGGGLVVSAAVLRAHLERSPRLALELARQERARVERLVDEIASLRNDRLPQRLLRGVARLVDEEGPCGNEIEIEIDQDDFAAMVGGSAPEVSRYLKKCVPRTVMQWRAGRLVISDIAKLQSIVDAAWDSPRLPT